MMIERELRVAVIGCGAVTELAHLPAAQHARNCRITLLVDPNTERRERLARAFDVERTAPDLVSAPDCFDAAIIAVPHVLHAPITLQLAGLGKSVLVEKPMANTRADCHAMIDAAERAGVLLGVGLMRRFLWAHRFARDFIAREVFGRVRSFDFSEGVVYFWPVASDFFFRKESAGGGVLIDAGAHTLDTLLHWLGPVAAVEYFDDAEGGVEANCLVKLRMVSGATGILELSRTRQLRNTAIIRMERGVLEVALAVNQMKVSLDNQPYAVSGPVGMRDTPDAQQDYLTTIADQMQDWVEAVRSGRQPFVDGRSAAESVDLIERCYRDRQPLELPWDEFNQRTTSQGV
jgi:predicted dehydrogenase